MREVEGAQLGEECRGSAPPEKFFGERGEFFAGEGENTSLGASVHLGLGGALLGMFGAHSAAAAATQSRHGAEKKGAHAVRATTRCALSNAEAGGISGGGRDTRQKTRV